jgi:hypothetical protein
MPSPLVCARAVTLIFLLPCGISLRARRSVACGVLAGARRAKQCALQRHLHYILFAVSLDLKNTYFLTPADAGSRTTCTRMDITCAVCGLWYNQMCTYDCLSFVLLLHSVQTAQHSPLLQYTSRFHQLQLLQFGFLSFAFRALCARGHMMIAVV